MAGKVRFKRKFVYKNAENREIAAETFSKAVKLRDSRLQDDVATLKALAAVTQVPVTRVETGKRTLTDKQIFLAVHATDSYQFDMRHFVGEMQAKLGMRSPRPVEPKPVVEKTADEIEAEREVFARRNWGRYWARKTPARLKTSRKIKNFSARLKTSPQD